MRCCQRQEALPHLQAFHQLLLLHLHLLCWFDCKEMSCFQTRSRGHPAVRAGGVAKAVSNEDPLYLLYHAAAAAALVTSWLHTSRNMDKRCEFSSMFH